MDHDQTGMITLEMICNVTYHRLCYNVSNKHWQLSTLQFVRASLEVFHPCYSEKKNLIAYLR